MPRLTSPTSRNRLADRLAEAGDLDGLRTRVDVGEDMPPTGWPNC
jgi:hypothetical protein